MSEPLRKVQIRPTSGILAILAHLNYKAWYALAEFVDNALQSYLSHKDDLLRLDETATGVIVDINIDPDAGTIVVRDRAAGISESEFPRAFRPAQPPPDRTGLSEFGMGMKTAACWFAHKWQVRTAALHEAVERTVRFDVREIQDTEIEELDIQEVPIPVGAHFTEIILECDESKIPKARTLGKIKEHLKSMYRRFLGDGRMILRVNGEALAFQVPIYLEYPLVNARGEAIEATSRLWYREFFVEFDGHIAYVKAGILSKGDTAHAGFALFRRDRLVVGSADETYRPQDIFGRPNDFRYQRIYGEIDLEGVDVTHTKDGFEWDQSEEEFITALKRELESADMPLLQQAENYRAKIASREEKDDFSSKADKVSSDVETSVQNKVAPAMAGVLAGTEPTATEPEDLPQSAVPPLHTRTFRAKIDAIEWEVRIEVADDEAIGELLEVAQRDTERTTFLSYRLALNHPFVRKYMGPDYQQLDLFYRLAAAVAISEAISKFGGTDHQGPRMRRYIGRVLKNLVPM